MELSEPKYEYQVSLRITHPTIASGSFTAALHLEPKTSWSVGDPCKDRNGGIVPGNREESYWVHTFHVTQDGDLPLSLSNVVSSLEARKFFFNNILSTGGSAELFVGYFINAPNTSIRLDPTLLKRCSELGLGIYVDIYG